MQEHDLGEFLIGLQENMPESFFHLAEIIKYDALEFCREKESGNYLIPYMMNDALEYYLILTNAKMTGEFIKEKAVIRAQIIQEESRYVLILHQEEQNICTLLFKSLTESAQCYQYHRIGHYWRKGQEHWRRLVYIVGTIHDKYAFFGDRFCTAKEKEVMHLMNFAPFRYWSPIGESLDEHYPDTEEGLECMKRLAREAADGRYLRLLDWYRRFPWKIFADRLAKELLKKEHIHLYELICKKVELASVDYGERTYEISVREAIEQIRRSAEEELKKRGYQGAYPHFYKDNEKLLITEEHPFTLMEWEDYTFRIHFLHRQDERVWLEEFV